MVSSPGLRKPRSPLPISAALPSIPGLRNSNRLHNSPRWFSIGVPLRARRCSAPISRAAFADWLLAFLIAWASSRMA